MHNRNANALRMLAIDAVERAQSGHPGAVMGMADIATVLWKHFVTHDPNNPNLPIRDRVILSNGHASMMLYGALHLMGYSSFSLDALRAFRQLGSITTGHPEYDVDAGIEYTTGPLGQGLAGAVGMALGERICAMRYNKEDCTLFDNYTYVFIGDGCLMEGISHEACSLAGTLGLHKLIVLYDSNGISIDGAVKPWFAEDVAMRFRAYGWNVIEDIDGHNEDAIYTAIAQARKNTSAPTLICFRTIIGYGSPNKAGSAKAHGSPLGAEEVVRVREAYNWQYEPFVIPEDVYEYWNAEKQGAEHTKAYENICEDYKNRYPHEWKELCNRRESVYPSEVFTAIERLKQQAQTMVKAEATRISSHTVLEHIVPLIPWIVGGSADLTPSVGTYTTASTMIKNTNFAGNYISYGVREFGMYAIMNGLSLYEKTLPYGGTFLVFTDYAKPALRLASMMKTHVIWVCTHDSIGVGEDGPTHQPIEHLTMLRSIPDIDVWRPADALETVYAWEYALTHNTSPIVLVLSRQNLPQLYREEQTQVAIARGGYILCDVSNPDVLLIGTGSEVFLAVEVQKQLREQGIHARVISMPSTTVFERQSKEYQESVLPHNIPVVVIEAGDSLYWYKYTGRDGCIISMQGYGASGKGNALFEHYGFSVEHIVQRVIHFLKGE